MPSDTTLIRARRKVEISPKGWDSLIDAPPVFAVKLTRKPTAYDNQRTLGIPLSEFPDHQCNLGIRLELMTTELAKPTGTPLVYPKAVALVQPNVKNLTPNPWVWPGFAQLQYATLK